MKFPNLLIILLMVMIHYFPEASPFVEHTKGIALQPARQRQKQRALKSTAQSKKGFSWFSLEFTTDCPHMSRVGHSVFFSLVPRHARPWIEFNTSKNLAIARRRCTARPARCPLCLGLATFDDSFVELLRC